MVDEAVLEAGLRSGDEASFLTAVQTWTPAMTRIARAFSGDPVVAARLVREAWLDVLGELASASGQPTGRLRASVLQAVVVRSRAAARERGSVLVREELPGADAGRPTVDPSRFRTPADPHPGGWKSFPAPWPAGVDLRPVLLDALDRLPGMQQAVVVLRDEQGCSVDEVCRMLDLAPEQQRAILHRGRATLRQAVEDHLAAS